MTHDHHWPDARRASSAGAGSTRTGGAVGFVAADQRMEASDGVVRGNVDSLMKPVGALSARGIELIGDAAASQGGGRGVRLASPS